MKTYFLFLWKDIQITYWKWCNLRLESKIAMIKIKAIEKHNQLENFRKEMVSKFID
jgi:hypothetical protein